MNKIPMTPNGAERLREELRILKTDKRPKVIAAIAEARGHGDLRENAEYHAAKDEQGHIEARVRDIEHKLANSQLIDVSLLKNDGKVVFGATLTLINLETDKTVQYQIVGEDEADLKSGKISISSPMARALIGKYESDVVEVQAPSGLIAYEIASVTY